MSIFPYTTEIDDNGLRYLQSSSLHNLDLSLNSISDAGLVFLPSSLKILDLSMTDVTNKGLLTLLPKGLMIVRAFHCADVSASVAKYMAEVGYNRSKDLERQKRITQQQQQQQQSEKQGAMIQQGNGGQHAVGNGMVIG